MWLGITITCVFWIVLTAVQIVAARREKRHTSVAENIIPPIVISGIVVLLGLGSNTAALLAAAVLNGGVLVLTLVAGLMEMLRGSRMKRLYGRLLDSDCIRFGNFKLKSGIMSPVYVDFRGLISNPELLKEVGEGLGKRAKQTNCDRLAGIPYAGLPLGVAASLASGIPMIYPRKEVKDYGTKKLIEGAYAEGEKVLVIDDIITDGASKIEAIKPLEEAGLVVKDVLIILDREQGGDKILAKAGYTLHSLGKLSEVLDVLVKAGKVDPVMQAKVAEFIKANQFA